MLLSAPLSGESLKRNLDGLRSAPVKRRYIIIYAYCRDCRARGCEPTNACPDCDQIPDDTLIFHIIAPHDEAYEQMTRFRK